MDAYYRGVYLRHMSIQHTQWLNKNNNNTRDTQTSLPKADNSVSTPLVKKDKTTKSSKWSRYFTFGFTRSSATNINSGSAPGSAKKYVTNV